MIEIRLQRLILCMLSCDILLALALLLIEPHASGRYRCRDDQELYPVPDRDVIEIANSDYEAQYDGDPHSPQDLLDGRSPVGHQQA
jgi:hypothetical protein